MTPEIHLDIIKLLKTEKYDTKPNMAKFLKTYVKSIRASISNGKVDLWPKICYDLAKCIVRFKDDLTVVKDYFLKVQTSVWRDDEQLNLKNNDIEILEKFFFLLEKFKFVRNGHEDVKVFSTDIEKTNKKLEDEMNCTQVKFIDYTPTIIASQSK